MTQTRQIKLAAYLIGTGMHVSSWRHPVSNPNASIDVKALQKLAQIAEKGKFDIAFIADSLAINHESHPQILNRFDPIVLITALAAGPKKLALVQQLPRRIASHMYLPVSLPLLTISAMDVRDGML